MLIQRILLHGTREDYNMTAHFDRTVDVMKASPTYSIMQYTVRKIDLCKGDLYLSNPWWSCPPDIIEHSSLVESDRYSWSSSSVQYEEATAPSRTHIGYDHALDNTMGRLSDYITYWSERNYYASCYERYDWLYSRQLITQLYRHWSVSQGPILLLLMWHFDTFFSPEVLLRILKY